MKRDFLKNLELTDEQINAIMAENGKDVNELKEQVNSLTTEKNGLQSQLSDRDGQLKSLKDAAKDNDELKSQVEQLQKDNKAATEKFTAEMAAQKKAYLVNQALTEAGARNTKAMAALLDLDSVSVKDDQLVGLTDQLNSLRESDGYMFKEEVKSEPKPQTKPAGVQITSGQPNPEGKPATIDFAHASYQEIKAFKDEHPQEYAAMTKDN